MRTVPEWIGKTDDAAIPLRVRLRVFERANGICHLSGRRIAAGEPWDCDHVVALVNGGEHRETNLAPALRDKHREKSAAENSDQAKADRTRAKHLGIHPRGQRIPSRPFRGRGFVKDPLRYQGEKT